MTVSELALGPLTDGRVELAEREIITIIHTALVSCYGIVDLSPRSARSTIGKRLGFSSERRGISVRVLEGRVEIELSVVIEHGTPIFTVAHNAMETVKFHVERGLGMPVARIDINVDGLRINHANRSLGFGA